MLQKLYDFTMHLKYENHFGWRYVYKLNKLIVGWVYPLSQRNNKKLGTDASGQMVVSLTSYTPRINTVWVTIASLLNQTRKPAKVILWLAKEQFPEGMDSLPHNLVKLTKRGLDIRFCEEDLRSHKKYFYVFRQYPESFIVTADDDIIYPPEHLERLWEKHLEYPDCICCHYGHVITFTEQGKIESYEKWRGGVDGFTQPSLRLMPVGCNGVLYPPHCLDENLLDKEKFKKLCFSADDIWLKAMGVLKGTKAVTCNEGALVYFNVLHTEKNGLFKENTVGQKNNEAIKDVFSHYPQAEEKMYRTCQEKVEEWQYRVLVAHPGKQHSLRLAEALERKGMLCQYVTTMYDKEGTLTRTIIKLLKGKDKKKAQGRKSNAILDEKVKVFCELTGLMGRFLARIFPSVKVYNKWNDYMNRKFGRKVAKYAIRRHVDAVISYDNDSDEVFRILKEKAPEIKRILDVSIANRLYLKEVYEKDIRLYGEEGLKREQFNLWEKATINRLKKELENSQYFLVASDVVKNSLVFSGILENAIYKVPYGADIKQFTFKEREEVQSPVRLIFVGNVGYRKGCHHLLKVVSGMGEKQAVLKIAGGYDKELYEKYKSVSNIEFLNFVTRDKLLETYQEADVFVLASLGEGMAMVGIEALACGLPVICTDMTGINDIIQNEKNGFVIPAGDEKALHEKIEWFSAHPDRIRGMSIAARKTAEVFTWENYYENVTVAVKKILELHAE
ncbi:MAG: glycosyltransferase family 4 protein [Lachnospiraceae bacterium]|nr:glycosyltransferase family 4 protein [Lachnospiraceae bacterium]